MSGHRDAAHDAGRKIANAVHVFVKASMARAEKERGQKIDQNLRTGEEERLERDVTNALISYGEELLKSTQKR
jgi:hypothetical protein